MPSVAVRDIQAYYEIQGEGPRVLFIGGSGGDLRQKPGVFEGPLPRKFEVLSYDQRGLGRSDTPPGPYDMEDYAEDAAALLDALGWERCAVIGVSFGGMVAQALAALHPQRITRMVLACTSAGGDGGASYPLHELADLPVEERAARTLELSDTRYDAAWRAANPETAAKLLRFTLERLRTGEGEPGRDAGHRLQLAARWRHDRYARLPGIRIPVLVCGGRYDGIAPVANQQAMANAVPNARLELFEGGHMFLLQDGSAWTRILEFLDER